MTPTAWTLKSGISKLDMAVRGRFKVSVGKPDGTTALIAPSGEASSPASRLIPALTLTDPAVATILATDLTQRMRATGAVWNRSKPRRP
jgi:hypothetical protein